MVAPEDTSPVFSVKTSAKSSIIFFDAFVTIPAFV
jgi:hypothetical protein